MTPFLGYFIYRYIKNKPIMYDKIIHYNKYNYKQENFAVYLPF